MEELINKIMKNGYWKVIIRPVEFKENRMANKDQCEEIINKSKLSLRGWDYPHIDHRERIFRMGTDSVASLCDWKEREYYEYWQFYQNGQFVHYFSMREDSELDEKEKERARQDLRFSDNPKAQINRFLSIINALYSITEIYLFAVNLAKNTDYGNEIEIIIELGNVKERMLFFWGEYRMLSGAYICKYEPIVLRSTMKTNELISNATDFALDMAIGLYKEFNWKNPNKDVFVGDQQKLIQRRF